MANGVRAALSVVIGVLIAVAPAPGLLVTVNVLVLRVMMVNNCPCIGLGGKVMVTAVVLLLSRNMMEVVARAGIVTADVKMACSHSTFVKSNGAAATSVAVTVTSVLSIFMRSIPFTSNDRVFALGDDIPVFVPFSNLNEGERTEPPPILSVPGIETVPVESILMRSTPFVSNDK